MKKCVYIIPIMLLVSCLCISCGESDNKDGAVMDKFQMFVRFQTPSGENIANSLDLFRDDINKTPEYDNKSNMNLEVVSENDGRNLFYDNRQKGWFNWDNPETEFKILGNEDLNIIYCFTYADGRVWAYGIKNYDDVYRISLKNPYIFGDSETHVIRLFVHVDKAAVYKIYKCEYDGMDITTPEMYGSSSPDGSYATRIALRIVVNK